MTFQYGNRISHKCKYFPLVLIAAQPVSSPRLAIDWLRFQPGTQLRITCDLFMILYAGITECLAYFYCQWFCSSEGMAARFLPLNSPLARRFLRYNFWTDKFPTPNFSSQVATFNCSKKYSQKNQTRRRPNNKNVADCCILWCCSKVTNYVTLQRGRNSDSRPKRFVVFYLTLSTEV